jgi:hypothetical protein
LELDWRCFSKSPPHYESEEFVVLFERVHWVRGDQEGGAEPCNFDDPGARAELLGGFQSMTLRLSPTEAEQFEWGKTYRATFG